MTTPAFFTGVFFLLLSIVSHVFFRGKHAIGLLIVSSFFLSLFASTLYPFVQLWDERFHALVAKNMLKHFIMPTLYDDPVITMDYNKSWATGHIWLHTQPLFLWQIALSYKLFGVNEFALRFPSIVLTCALVYAAYRSGKIIGNEAIGYYTAFFITTSFYLLELTSGWQELDHNDLAFLVYISLSLWGLLEYIQSGKTYWILLIGIFSGFAVLCKWLVGLLVYLCWGVYTVLENKTRLSKYRDYAAAFLVTVVIALPWQLYVLYRYPAEARLANLYNVEHFLVPLDGHSGTFFFYFSLIGYHFGKWAPYLVGPALIVFLLKAENKKIAFSLLVSVLFVYLFFSFAATKMPSFTTVVLLPVFMAMAFLVDFLFSLINRPAVFLLLVILATIQLDYPAWREQHSFLAKESDYTAISKHNKTVFQRLHLPANAVIFNLPTTYVDGMFYTGFPAYGFVPSAGQFAELKNKKRTAVFFNFQNKEIPPFLKEDKDVLFLKDTIELY